MKVSKQLLKEIITEEYNMMLCEGAINDVLRPAVEKFGAALRQMPAEQRDQTYSNSRNTIMLILDIVTFFSDYYKNKDTLKNKISNIDTSGSYNKLLSTSVQRLLDFVDSYIKGSFDSRAINDVSMALNQATKNLGNVENFNTAKDIYTDDTQPFAMG